MTDVAVFYTDGVDRRLVPRDVFSIPTFNDGPLSLGVSAVNVYPLGKTQPLRAIEPLQIVVVDAYDDAEQFFGYAADAKTIFLAAKKIGRIPSPVRVRFARWILRHELGHLHGLRHHFDPFCLMSVPNISFGRFCGRCSNALQKGLACTTR